jgi:TPR repeat protein
MLQDNRNIQANEPYIFIGYSKRDSENVSNDVKWMTSAGYKVKFNNTFENYQISQQNEEIKSCKQFVVFVSDVFNEDKGLKNQIDYALANKICIAIVYIGKVTLNGYYDILFSSISSIEKYDLDFNDYFHKLASVLDEKCKNVIFHNPPQNNKNKFKVNIDYDSFDEKPMLIESIEKQSHVEKKSIQEIRHVASESFDEINPPKIIGTNKLNLIESYKHKITKKHMRILLLSASLIVGIAIIVISIFFIRNYLAQQNFTTGLKYYNGDMGVDTDKQAYNHLLKSANYGNTDAMLYLGKMYLAGNEVNQDKVKALDWITKSATQSNAPAEQFLGDLYFGGKDIKQDYAQAFKWYLKSSENKNVYAQEKLGEIYLNGYGTKINYAQAAKWFGLAAAKGNSNAQLNLGYLYNNGYGVAKDYAKAMSLYLKSAEQNNIKANYNIGVLYENGYGIIQDYKKAFDYYTIAATKHSPDAEYALANLYYTGHGVAKDNQKAANLFITACKDGNKDAPAILKTMYESRMTFNSIDLADMYYYGWGIKKDLGSAKKYYQRSANGGDLYAKEMIKNGIFV